MVRPVTAIVLLHVDTTLIGTISFELAKIAAYMNKYNYFVFELEEDWSHHIVDCAVLAKPIYFFIRHQNTTRCEACWNLDGMCCFYALKEFYYFRVFLVGSQWMPELTIFSTAKCINFLHIAAQYRMSLAAGYLHNPLTIGYSLEKFELVGAALINLPIIKVKIFANCWRYFETFQIVQLARSQILFLLPLLLHIRKIEFVSIDGEGLHRHFCFNLMVIVWLQTLKTFMHAP